jgi:hypothetical protein
VSGCQRTLQQGSLLLLSPQHCLPGSQTSHTPFGNSEPRNQRVAVYLNVTSQREYFLEGALLTIQTLVGTAQSHWMDIQVQSMVTEHIARKNTRRHFHTLSASSSIDGFGCL